MPTFRSEHAELRVGFPPERFGLGEGWEEYFDNHGNVCKRKIPYPAVKFDFGVAVVDETTAKRLRKHDGFLDRVFWEQSEVDTRALAGLQLAQAASLPDGGLTENDRGRLDEFARMAGKVLAPTSLFQSTRPARGATAATVMATISTVCTRRSANRQEASPDHWPEFRRTSATY